MNRDLMLVNTQQYLDEMEYYSTPYAKDYVDKSILAKEKELAPILRKHPMWDEERGFISFVLDVERRIDYENLCDIFYWITNIPYRYKGYEDLRYSDAWASFTKIVEHMVRGEVGMMPDDKIVEWTNDLLSDFDRGHISRELKNSKIVGKLAGLFELDKIVDMQTVSWTDHATGEYREKQKDKGWNYKYALFCDSINPKMVRKRFVLSIAPIAFLAMSNGESWDSCHNIYNGDGDPGCYSGGTMSYGLDHHSMVGYYVPEDTDIKNVEFEPKLQRCMFFWGEGKLIQSRLYPDGRDGGDFGLSEQMRNTVRQIFAECLGFPNVWRLKAGHKITESFIITKGVQYPDYHYYNDVNTSFPWVMPENYKKMVIGKNPICPSCGTTHTNESSILCERCTQSYDYYCDRCNSGFDEYDSDAVYTADGRRFCCEECARADGYVLTVDTESWIYEDDAYYDDYEGEYFESNWDLVETEDGKTYRNPDNAEADGYVFTSDTEVWIREDNAYQDAFNEVYYEYEPEICTYDGSYYVSAENAEADGWTYNEDTDEWERKEVLNEAV